MSGITDREGCLQDVLRAVGKDYDYTIVDCPPAVGLLTFNALRAASDVIVPVETGYFALHGLSRQLETLSILCERCNHNVNVKVLASMYDIRTKMAREIMAELRNHFSDKMCKTIVNFNTKLKEAASFGQPITEYDPASRGQRDFKDLAQEIIAAESIQQRRQTVDTLSTQLESISTTASELMKQVMPIAEPVRTQEPRPAKIEEIKPAKQELPQPITTQAKLADYYGANQINDAIVFVTLYPRADSVHIAGDFNNWQPEKTPMEKVGTSGVWQTKLALPAGKHRYRLVVDGQWQQDPYNERTEINPFGELNSIVEVK
jgi:chromosome partitioning protein